jgi:3',5'-cyclic AMP phosphodiesterase CpdA
MVVIGDTQPTFWKRSYRVFEREIEQINALKPDIVINLGDQIYGYGLSNTEKEWERYDLLVKRIKAPYYRVPGNHDVYGRKSERLYLKRYGRPFYSADVKGFHLIFLDTMESGVWGKIGPVQLGWLKKDLAFQSGRKILAFTHVPVWFPKARHVKPIWRESWMREIQPLLRNSRVMGVFAGHFHRFGPNLKIGRIKYYITGGGGGKLTRVYARAGGTHHFVLATASDAGLVVKVVTPDGIFSEEDADVVRKKSAAASRPPAS